MIDSQKTAAVGTNSEALRLSTSIALISDTLTLSKKGFLRCRGAAETVEAAKREARKAVEKNMFASREVEKERRRWSDVQISNGSASSAARKKKPKTLERRRGRVNWVAPSDDGVFKVLCEGTRAGGLRG